MKNKPASLSLHKNTLEKRKRKELRASLIKDAKRISTLENLSGYALVAWDKEGRTMEGWDTSNHTPIPARLMPSFVKDVFRQKLHEHMVRSIIES